ncbi:MAG: DUF4249 domain-containing protein [Marinoscillum sp.]
MKILNPYNPAIFFMTILLIWSCETIIDVDLPKHEPAIVLNSFFGTDTTFQVRLAQSKDILDGSYEFKTVSGALVELYKNETLIGEMTESEPGFYTLLEYPEQGASYRILASKQGFESVESEDIVPQRTANPQIEKIERKTNEYNDQLFHLTYSLEDQQGEDFYEVLVFIYIPRYDYYSDEDTSYQYFNGYWKERVYYNEVGAELNEFEDTGDPTVFSDELFNGKKFTNTIEIYYYYYDEGPDPQKDKAKLTMEVRHLSEAMYLYKKSLKLQEDSRDNPFAEAAQVYNNIKDGYGIFAGYSVEAIEYEFDPQ